MWLNKQPLFSLTSRAQFFNRAIEIRSWQALQVVVLSDYRAAHTLQVVTAAVC
jgi:hypothetical protein